MGIDIKGFHIEPTNICTLKCPRCARTEFINKFPSRWKNKQLNLEDFKKFIDIDISNKVFNLCGNYGDPIYYNQLFEMILWLKQNGASVVINTNGSYKTQNWWKELCSIIDFNDGIVFAIDGTTENFTNYRVNADWDSIAIGIQEAVKYTNTTWKFIPFAFNEHEIEKAKKLSTNLGIQSFHVEPSHRWESSDDLLKPKNLVNQKSEHVINWVKYTDKDFIIDAQCKKTHVEHYISAEGYYMPCCFVGDHRFYFSSEFYKNKEKYDIRNSTITSILENLTDFYSSIEDNKLKYCTFNCPKI